MGDLSDLLSQSFGQSTGNQGYNPDTTNNLGSMLVQHFSGMLKDMTTPSADPSSFMAGNPEFNTSDVSRIDKDQEALQGWFGNAWNAFKRGIDETQKGTAQGKMEYSMLGDGPAHIVDTYPDQLAALDGQLARGVLTQGQYDAEKASLDHSYENAQKDVAEYQKEIDDNDVEISKEPVSKKYLWKQAMTQAAGDSAGLIDKLLYTAPNMIGSSAGLMVPQLLATFGNNVTKALIRSAASELAGPEIGVPVQAIATVGALATSVAEIMYGRSQESYGEVAQGIMEARQKLVDKYMQAHGLTDANQIDPEAMRQIRIQSRKGANTQYWENMALSTVDIAAAMLMPLGNLSSTVAKLGTLTEDANDAIAAAKNYNKLTRRLSTIGKFGTEQIKEKFEEGFQQGVQYRAEDKALGNDGDQFYGNSGILSSILEDAYDTATSLDYSLLPGFTLRGNGRYAKDPDFQFSENSGGLLGAIMGGLPTALSLASDIKGYRAANKDLAANGIIDVDGKLKRLQTSIMKKYMDEDGIHYLGEAIKSLAGKQDEQGNPMLSKSDASQLIKDMHDAYEFYQPISDKIDGNIAKDKLLGLRDSKELKVAREMLKEDLLNTSMNIVMRQNLSGKLDMDRTTQLEKDMRLQSDPEVSELVAAMAQTSALKEMIAEHKDNAALMADDIHSAHMEQLDNALKQSETQVKQLLTDRGFKMDSIAEPTKELIDAHKAWFANDLFKRDALRQYTNLSKVNNKSSLMSYLTKTPRTAAPESNLDQTIKEEAPIEEQPEAPQQYAPEEQPTQGANEPIIPADTPPVEPTTDEDLEAMRLLQPNFKPVFEGEKPLNERANTLSTAFNDIGVDPKLITIPDAFSGLRDVFSDDPDFLKTHFNTLKQLITMLNPKQGEFDLDEGTMSLIERTPVPPVQSGDNIDGENSVIVDKIRQLQDDPYGSGLKIVSGLSVAMKHVEGVKDTTGQWKDDRGTDGKLSFVGNNDQQLANTNLLKVGDVLTIKIENLNGAQVASDVDLDKADIAYYKTVDLGGGATRQVHVGYMHKIESLPDLLAESSDLNAEQARIRLARMQIIEAGEGATFTSKITSKGFGYLNTNRKTVKTTVKVAIGDDTRPRISVIDNTGKGLPIGKMDVIQPSAKAGPDDKLMPGMRYGATVLWVPNETSDGTKFVPMYLTKNKLSTPGAEAIHETVYQSVMRFLKNGARKELQSMSEDKKFQAEAYVYITRNDKDLPDLGKSGVYTTVNKGRPSITVNYKNYTLDNSDGLKEALGDVYFSANRELLGNSLYQSHIMESPLLTTNITANDILLQRHQEGQYNFLKDNQQYQYFSQHTIESDFPTMDKAEPVFTIGREPDNFIAPESFNFDNLKVGDSFKIRYNWSDEFVTKTLFAKSKGSRAVMVGDTKENATWVNLDKGFRGDRLEYITNVENPKASDEAIEGLENLGISLDFEDDIVPDVEGVDDISGEESMLVSPEIPASLQHQMVDSMAFLLLKNEQQSGKTNTDVVREDVQNRYNGLEKALPSLSGANVDKANKLKDNYGLMLKHFDALMNKSRQLLESLGFSVVEDSDFYDSLQSDDAEDNFGSSFDDDSNSTRNQKDFLPGEVKKLIYFIPQLIPLDMTKPSDRAIYDADVNKREYKEVKNSLGMSSFNNFNDTWEKTLGVTSEYFFESSQEGFDKMILKLEDKNNSPVVQELAARLKTSKPQVKNAFFRRTNLQNQKNMTMLHILERGSRRMVKSVEEAYKKFARLIRSDRRQAERKVLTDLENEFRASRTGMMEIHKEEGTGREIYVINTAKAKQISSDITQIMDDKESYKVLPAKGNLPEKITNYFTDDTKVRIYNLIRETGLNMSYPAFNDLIKYYKTSLSESKGEASAVREIFVNRMLNTLSGKGNNDDKYTDYARNNPFVQDSGAMTAIAKQEYKYRVQRQSGAYRMDGKSYYAFTRHNYLSEMFTQIKEAVSGGSDYFITPKLSRDVFAKPSRWLNMLNDPTQKNFRTTFDMFYELGSRNTLSDNPVKQLKNMTPREHQVTKFALYQNQGRRAAIFMYDTLSDKTTKPLIQAQRLDVGYQYTGKGDIIFSDGTMNALYNYFEAEYGRIQQVYKENAEFGNSKNGLRHNLIEGYHDIGSKQGMGKYFNIYYFLNKAVLDVDNPRLSSAMYGIDGKLKDITPEVRKGIEVEINNHFNAILRKNKKDALDLELWSAATDPKTGRLDVQLQDLVDHDYLTKKYGVLERLGISVDKELHKSLRKGFYGDLGMNNIYRIVDYVMVDYLVNFTVFSNEMLMFTGDPAQAGKLASKGTINTIKSKYSDPLEAAKQEMIAHVQSTFVNLGKRNAAFLASGEKGLFDEPSYNVAIAKDIPIASEHLKEYTDMFPGNAAGVQKAYGDGDLTDAQEVTTVREHLQVMKAFGQVDPETYKKALYLYDSRAYNKEFKGSPNITQDDRERIKGVVMQPMKPVQRTYSMDSGLPISKQYYIKTSSYPLIPELVKGTPLEKLLDDMHTKGIYRIAFVSGVKQGVAGAKEMFIEDEYNPAFLENNTNNLSRDGFRIQLEVPYKTDKSHIREGTQQSKMLFVDVPDWTDVEFQGKQATVKDVKNAYIDYHKKIVDLQTKKLMRELANRRGEIDVAKLSKILQEEALGRGYALNSILGLQTKNGKFKIPLTFLPNAGQIEPVITAIVSNRVAKLKMPGKSYVQGAEFALRRGKVEEGKDIDRRGIIWTKPEYANLSKLQYLSKDKPAQIVMPFYFIKDGEQMDVKEFTKVIDGKTYLDTSRIDPELLQMNGFRIPFQGHNSGMWFEIVGFLPKVAGDLVLVPGEIAGQMGSDYDVDKLYAYMYNYFHKDEEEIERLGADADEWELLKRTARLSLADQGINPEEATKEQFNEALAKVVDERFPNGDVPKHKFSRRGDIKYDISKVDSIDPTTTEELQNAIIDAQKSIYMSSNEQIMRAILEPLSFADVEEVIDELGSEEGSEFLGAFDPTYQRDVYFSNVTGKFGTAVAANGNTSHAMAQVSNLFIKGQGVVFLRENGEPYSDYITGEDSNRVNDLTENTYTYLNKSKEDGETIVNQNSEENNSAWRLDKVNTFDENPKTGLPYRISNLISQILGVSVDNAKEQKLGAFGINRYNLNVVLSITRAGFGFRFSKAFVNQPILKEYYARVGDTEDIYRLDYTSNKRQAVVDDLFKSYKDKYGIKEDIQGREGIKGFMLSELVNSLGKTINQGNALQQLEVLKAFLYYKDISDSLQGLTSTFNVDVQGLPKNMSETARKAETISNTLNGDSMLGNVNAYSRNTIPGLFKGIPLLATKLFMAQNDPLFAYDTDAYKEMKTNVAYLTGKNNLFNDQIDLIHNHIKQFIYSGFRFGGESLKGLRERLLFDKEGSDSLQTRLLTLKELFPKNDLLNAIDIVSSVYPNNPKLIEIQMSNEDDYVQKVSEYWEHMLQDTEHPDLQSYAEDLVKYAIYVSPQEYGTSNIIKYIPFSYLEKIGFTDYLNDMHQLLALDSDMFGAFSEQFIMHNEDFLASAREKHFIKGSEVYGEGEMVEERGMLKAKQGALNVFTLPAINLQALGKNPAATLVRVDDDGTAHYPKYLKVFNNEKYGVQIYRGSTKSDGTVSYYRVEKLGDNNMSEYNFHGIPGTLIDTNKADYLRPTTDSAAVTTTIGNASFNDFEAPIAQKDYLREKNADDILYGIIQTNNDIVTNADETDTNRSYARLYQFLAKSMQFSGLDRVNVIIDDRHPTPGSAALDGKSVIFNPRLMGIRKTGLSKELEKQRTVLHELIHAKAFSRPANDPAYKNVEAVWEAYKDAVRKNTTGEIRGIPVSAFDAELFAVLRQMWVEAKASKDTNIRSLVDFAKAVLADDLLSRGVLKRLGDRLAQLAKEGKIKDKNFDLVSSDSRLADFKEYIAANIIPNADDIVNKYYAYHDVKEFITEAMTNKRLQDVMRGIPSLWKQFVNSIKELLAELFGITTEERTLFDDAIDSIFKYLDIAEDPRTNDVEYSERAAEEFKDWAPEPQEEQSLFDSMKDRFKMEGSVDTYKYYGAEYKIVRNADGKAIDVVGYAGKYANKKKLMDAYNANPDVDPQNGKAFRGAVEAPQQSATSDREYTTPDGKKITFNDQQYEALGNIKEWLSVDKGLFYTLSGYAGTGKTTIVNKAIDGLKRVAVSAPTHKAKAVIAKATGRPAITIQSLLGLRPNVDLENFDVNNPQFDPLAEKLISKYKTIVLDEASMLSKDLFGLLIEEAKTHGTRILLMGDEAQLPPVGESKSLVFVSPSITNRSLLTKVERQAGDNPLMSVYDAIRNNLSSAVDSFAHETKTLLGKGITFFKGAGKMQEQIKATFGTDAYKKDKNYAKALAWTNNAVTYWNNYVRDYLFGADARLIEPGDTIMSYNSIKIERTGTDIQNSSDYEVNSVKEITNDYGIKIYRTLLKDVDGDNMHTVDVVVPTQENLNKLVPLLKGIHSAAVNSKGKERGRAWAKYYSFKNDHILMAPLNIGGTTIKKDIDYGYALTVHKSQGSTYKYVFVDENNLDSNPNVTERNQLKYVAFSRPTDMVYSLSQKTTREENLAQGDDINSTTGYDDLLAVMVDQGLIQMKCN